MRDEDSGRGRGGGENGEKASPADRPCCTRGRRGWQADRADACCWLRPAGRGRGPDRLAGDGSGGQRPPAKKTTVVRRLQPARGPPPPRRPGRRPRPPFPAAPPMSATRGHRDGASSSPGQRLGADPDPSPGRGRPPGGGRTPRRRPRDAAPGASSGTPGPLGGASAKSGRPGSRARWPSTGQATPRRDLGLVGAGRARPGRRQRRRRIRGRLRVLPCRLADPPHGGAVRL